jgi:hypothetical protein
MPPLPPPEIKKKPSKYGWQHRPVSVEEMKPDSPEPPRNLVERAMKELPCAWQEIGMKIKDDLVKKMCERGRRYFACEWALFRHVELGHIKVELWSLLYKEELCDSETGEPLGIFFDREKKEYHLQSTAQLWTWWKKVSEEPINPTLAVSPAEKKIPAEERTKPMSYRSAALLLGKGKSKDAAEWLSASVKNGAIPCEHISRQMHVFSKLSFPENVWFLILPDSSQTDGK